MKRFAIIFWMFLAAISSLAYSKNDKCAALSEKLSKSYERSVICNCGSELSNLQITLPRGLRIKAACLSNIFGSSIDLKKEKVSLDYYDKSGNMPMGEIYLSGQITLAGSARMEPSEGGDLYFGTKCNIPHEPAFLRNFCQFRLERDADYKKLGVPKPRYTADGMMCWFNKVTLNIINPVVSLNDSEGAGTSPSNIVVLKKTKPVFFKCYQNNQQLSQGAKMITFTTSRLS
jgi:hypothetical protein